MLCYAACEASSQSFFQISKVSTKTAHMQELSWHINIIACILCKNQGNFMAKAKNVQVKRTHSDQYARVCKNMVECYLSSATSYGLVELWCHFIKAKKQTSRSEVTPHWRLARLHLLSLFDPVIGLVGLWHHFIEAKKQTPKREVTPHWRLAWLHLLYLYKYKYKYKELHSSPSKEIHNMHPLSGFKHFDK
jgi:hypothetical protein